MNSEVISRPPAVVSPPVQIDDAPRARLGREVSVALAALIAFVLVAVLHLAQGAAADIGLVDVWGAILGTGDPAANAVITGGRMPRTVAGIVAGVALGLSGAMVQGATRNPLAAPDTLGVNAGAYLALALVASLGIRVGIVPQGGAAFIGGLAAAMLVYLLAGRTGIQSPGRVLLAGTAVALTATSGAILLMLLDEQSTQGLFFWGNGSLLQAGGMDRPLAMGAVAAVAALLVPLMARRLDLLSLGDDTAEALGVRVSRVRLQGFVLSVAFSAAAVTVAGPIAFVGLVAPIATKMMGIRRHAWLLPIAALVAAILVLGADALAQALLVGGVGGEVPVGVVTALVGGPVFLILARQVPTGGVDTGAAVTVGAPSTRARYLMVNAAVVAVILASFVVGVSAGAIALDPGQVLASLVGMADPGTTMITSFRLPRVLAAAIGGACLAAAGATVQAVIRNPLAEPGLMGVTGGSSIAAVAVISLAPTAPRFALPVGAMVGGVLALAVVMALARRAGSLDPTRVILVGIGLAATTAAIVQILALRSHLAISAALTWLAGSTYGRSYADLAWTPMLLIVLLLVVVFARPLDMMVLGDDLPEALGLSLTRARLITLVGSAILASGAAAVIGAVAFVGLVAPHIARRLVGSAHRRMVPTAVLLGAAIVVLADTIGRLALEPRQIPVGVVTALIGAPYLIWLLRRQAASR